MRASERFGSRRGGVQACEQARGGKQAASHRIVPHVMSA